MPFHPIKVPGGNELLDAKKVLEIAGLSEGARVADLGCGARGYFSLQAAKLVGTKGVVYAVDILKSALNGVESNARLHGLSNIRTLWSDLEKFGATKLPENYLDFALLINILFQTVDDETVIKEAVRLLKRGGKLLVVDWKKTGAPFGPPIQDRSSPEEIKQIVNRLGLKLEKEFEAGPYHYGLVFIKE
jgi:ubiquinone/menaquinone biosynthesis C-methylase UbiE